MRRLIAALAGASVVTIALGVSAAPASLSRKSMVVFQGSGSYRLRYVLKSGEAFDLSASFKLRTVFPTAFFTQGVSGAKNLSSINDSSYTGSWSASVTEPGHPTLCSGKGEFGNPSAHTTPAVLVYTWSSDTGRLSVHAYGLPNNELATASRHANDCAGKLPDPGNAGTARDFWGDWVGGFSQIPALSARFSFPGVALEADQATETISATASKLPGTCRSVRYRVCTQTYKWAGSVTFTRIG